MIAQDQETRKISSQEIQEKNLAYRVFQLNMLHFKRLLSHQKSTFKS